MFKEINKRGKIKLILTIIFSIAGLVASALFACGINGFNNANQQSNLHTEIIKTETNKNVISRDLTLNWNTPISFKNSMPKATPVASGYGDGYTWEEKVSEAGFSFDNLPAGTVVTVTKGSGNTVHVNFNTDNDSEIEGYYLVTPDIGYTIEYIRLGNANKSDVAEVTPGSNESYTVEELDEDYTGQLVFGVKTKDIEYDVEFYHKEGVTSGEYTAKTEKYSIEKTIDASSVKVDGVNEWWFDATQAGVAVNTSGLIVINHTQIHVTYTTQPISVEVSKGTFHDCYVIETIAYVYNSSTSKANPNFTDAGGNQTVGSPIIIGIKSGGDATYNFTIKNENETYWNGCKNNLVNIGKELNQLTTTKEIVKAVKVKNGDTDSNGDISFDELFVSNAFETSSAVAFSYGHTCYGYNIYYTMNGKKAYVGYDGSKWSTRTTASDILIDDISETSFGDLLEGLLAEEFKTLQTKPTVYIVPSWDSVLINVEYEGENIITEGFDVEDEIHIEYGSNYALSKPTLDGFLCYQQDDVLVPLDAVWNFTGLSYQYVDEWTYSIELDIKTLGIISKVELTEVLVGYNDFYYLAEDCGYIFSSSAGSEPAGDYNYIEENTLTSYDNWVKQNMTKPFVDYYTTNIANGMGAYIANYNGIVAGNSGLCKYVHYSSGTWRGNYKLGYSADATMWIYMPQDVMIEDVGLPTFVYSDSTSRKAEFINIGWASGSVAYQTNDYESTYEAEATWETEWGNESSILAIYVYLLKMYYASGNTNLLYDDSPYYGVNTAVEFENYTVTVGTTDSEGWLFHVDNATTLDYAVDFESADGGIDTNGDGVDDFEFTYNADLSTEGLLYLISFQGWGMLNQNASTPIIIAKFPQSYEIKITSISSDGVYWQDIDNANDDNYYGAIADGDTDSNFAETSIRVTVGEATELFFQTESGLAFLGASGMSESEGAYFVYNYGYDLTKWVIHLVCGEINQYLNYEGGEWKFIDSVTEIEVEIETLTGVTINSMVNAIYDKYSTATDEAFVTLTPKWAVTSVQVYYGNSGSSRLLVENAIKFALGYNFIDECSELEANNGQTFFSLQDDSGNLVAIEGVWNYTSLSGYEYVSDNTYSIVLEMKALNDVYKVSLTGMLFDIADGKKTYELGGENFTFFGDPSGAETLTYLDFGISIPQYSSTTYEGKRIETFITLLTNFAEDYEKNIKKGAGGSFNVLKRVYHTEGNSTNTTLACSLDVTPEFYIYLANGQETDVLPKFVLEWAEQISWKNTNNQDYLTSGMVNGESKFVGNDLEVNTIITEWDKGALSDLTLTAVNIYRLDFYHNTAEGPVKYELDDFKNELDSLDLWYGEISGINFANIEPNAEHFNSWIIYLPNATDYTVSANSIVDNNESLDLKFSTSNYVANRYYELSGELTGYGVLKQTTSKPIIIAYFAQPEITFTINNSGAYWSEEGLEGDSALYGAVKAGEDTNEDFHTATITYTKATSSPNFVFQKTNYDMFGTAFYKLDDYCDLVDEHISNATKPIINSYIDENNFYYVYNYGHIISGWIIELSNTDYVVINDGEWDTSTTKTAISISDLDSKNFASLVDFVGITLGGIYSNITLIPSWQGANIREGYAGTEFNYAGTFVYPTFNDDVGKTGFAFAFEDTNALIANNAIWNYKDEGLNKDAYTYSSGTYTVGISPVYLPNIYKITLTGVHDGTFSLENFELLENSTSAEDYYAYNNIVLAGALTEYSSVSGEHPLVESYVTAVLKDYFDSFNEGIDCDGTSDYNILNRVHISNDDEMWIYLVHDQVYSSLPVFISTVTIGEITKNMAVTIAWNDENLFRITNKYTEILNGAEDKESQDISSEITGELEEESKWSYSEDCNRTFVAVYVYSLDLHYIYNESVESEDVVIEPYRLKTISYYGINTPLAIEALITNDDVVEGKVLTSEDNPWILDGLVAKNVYGYDVGYENGIVTLSKDGKVIHFGYTGIDGNSFLGLTYVQGDLFLAQDSIINGSLNPIIYAQTTSEAFDVIIDNTARNYWTSLVDADALKTLTGAVSYEELNDEEENKDNNDFKTYLKIGNFAQYAYKFQETSEFAFYKLSRYNELISEYEEAVRAGELQPKMFNSYLNIDAYYYVFNYGHKISGWTIVLSNGKYVVVEGGEFTVVDARAEIEIDDLDDLTFDKLAKCIDNSFPKETNLSVKLIPSWTAVKIKINNSQIVTYGEENYELNITGSSVGQEQISLTYDDEYNSTDPNATINLQALVANKAAWNYYNKNNLSKDISTYYGFNAVSGNYNLTLYPVFINNIYKVTLSGIIPNGENTYTFESSSYSFATTKYQDDVYTFKNDFGQGELEEYSSTYPCVDDYITTKLYAYQRACVSLMNYNEDLLEKVFYSTGSVNDKTLTAENPSIWIYLTHNGSFSNLPVFDNANAKLIAYKDNNIDSEKGYYKTLNYSDEFAEEVEDSDAKTVWTYACDAESNPLTTTFNATYVYSLSLYYQNKFGYYSYKSAEWYGANMPELVIDEKLSLDEILANRVLSDEDHPWMFDAYVAENTYGLTVVDKTGYVEVSKDSVLLLSFTYISKNGTEYLGLTSVQGFGVLPQTISGEIIPIVYADFAGVYTVTINNESAYWSNTLFASEIVGANKLYGAISSYELLLGEDDGNFAKTSFMLDRQTVNGKFQNNFGLAFNKFDNYNNDIIEALNSYNGEDSYYFVYSYGFEIIGWKIILSNGKYVVFDGTNWNDEEIVVGEEDSIAYSSIDDLTDVNFGHLSSFIDNIREDEVNILVTLIPVWQGAEIQVKDNGTTVGRLNYGDVYELDETTTENLGHSFVSYQVCDIDEKNAQLITLSGVWNYYKNDDLKAKYGYNDTSKQYTLNVEPYWTQNIYQISLNKVLPVSTYKLINTDYVFHTSSNGYNGADLSSATVLTYRDKVDDTYSFVEYNDEPLMDIYIDILEGCCNDFRSGLEAQSLTIFNKVFYESGNINENGELETAGTDMFIYLAHTYEFGSMPAFEHSSAKLIAWKETSDGSSGDVFVTNLYDEDKYSAEVKTDDDNVWTLNSEADNTALYATYVYAIDLYYEDNNIEDGVYSYVRPENYYGVNTVVDVSKVSVGPDIPDYKQFDCWMLNSSNLDKTVSIDKSEDDDKKFVTISWTEQGFEWFIKFEYASEYETSDGKTYYLGVTNVSGDGLLTQDSNAPVVHAKFFIEVDFVVNNQTTYWNEFNDEELSSLGYIKQDLYGAVSSNGTATIEDEEYIATTTFRVGEKGDENKYPFQTNNGYAFFKYGEITVDIINSKVATDIENQFNYYYVYNYGFEISNWKVEVKIGEEVINLYYDGTNWVKGEGTNADLTSQYLSNIVEFISNEWPEAIETIIVTIYPEWVESQIDVVYADDDAEGGEVKAGDVTYTQIYSLTPADDTPGQKFFAYQVVDQSNQLITEVAVWNYLNIESNKYVYDEATYEYKLNVVPVYLDNIYKVNLNNIIANNEYELTLNSTYSFNSKKGDYSEESTGVETFLSYVDSTYEFNYYNNQTFVDTYMSDLASYRAQYIAGLTNSSFEIFNVVYYSLGELNGTKLTNASGTTMSIYLANNHAFSNSPAFTHKYAKIIAWSSNETEIQDKSFYLTSEFTEDLKAEIYEYDLNENRPETWLYNEFNIILNTVYAYRLELYYLTDENTYSFKEAAWYASETNLEITATIEESEIPDRKFIANPEKPWMLNKLVANGQYGLTVTAEQITTELGGTINTVTLTATGINVVFTYDSMSSNGNYFYGITFVKGYGVLDQYIRGVCVPYIYAELSDVYDLVVDNSSSYWTTMQNEEALYGAISTNETINGDDTFFNKTYLTIANSSDVVSYSFQTNNSYAFLKLTDYNEDIIKNINSYVDNENYYYVYNYGFEISGWTIKLSNGEYVIFNDGEWDTTVVKTENAINVLEENNLDFKALSAYLDRDFKDSTDLSITIYPNWVKAQIDVMNETTCVGTVTYTNSYTLNDASAIDGKEFFTYKVKNTEQILAKSAVWNYLGVEIAQNSYSDGKYALYVEPIYLDSVYRLNLANVITANTTYSIKEEDNGYKFFTSGTNRTQDILTFNDLQGAVVTYNEAVFANGENQLVENYIANYIVEYIENYVEKIDSDGTDDFDVFKNVFYSTGIVSNKVLTATNPTLWIYLANNQTYSVLPVFERDDAKLIAWNYGEDKTIKTSEFVDDYNQELVEESRSEFEGSIWSYSAGYSALNALYVYAIDLYYEDNNASDGIYSSVRQGYYGKHTPLTLTDLNVTNMPAGYTFKGWMIDSSVAVNTYKYTIDDSKESILNITETRFTLDFTYGEKHETLPYYYQITSVQGTGLFEQVEITPIITALYNKEYDVIIDNSNASYWSSARKDDSTLYGASSSQEIVDDGDFAKTQIIVSNSEDDLYVYGFQSNAGLAFNKQSKYTTDVIETLNSYIDANKYYYVYNYGHEIIGWKISSNGSSYVYYHNAEKSKWEWKVEDSYSTIEDLDAIHFENVAAFMDNTNPTATGRQKITLTPIWESVEINVLNNGTEITNISSNSVDEEGNVVAITFGEAYALLTTSIVRPNGKELFAFTYNNSYEGDASAEQLIIATNAKWNYFGDSISNSYEYVDGDYQLNVYPIFLDNIYKIKLSNVKVFETEKYVLDQTDYKFNNAVGSYNNVLKYTNTFTYSDGSQYQFLSYNNENFVDDYIVNLLSYKLAYLNGIANGEFTVFRKVYYSNVNANTTEATDTELTVEGTPEFSIYLANNQDTGALPMFKKQYYTNILWQNDYVYSSNSYYVYKTNKFDYSLHSQELDGFLFHDGNKDNIPDNLWKFEDGFNGDSLGFTAVYYRKFYTLDIKTLLDGNIERRGYVVVQITDCLYQEDSTIDNMGGYFIVIAEKYSAEMKVYRVDTIGGSLMDQDLTNVELELRLYEGCDITATVKDQSQDYRAMQSANFDEMIGYKFSQTIHQFVGEQETEALTGSGYVYSADKDSIDAKAYADKSIIEIRLPFEKIAYQLNIRMDNIKAGQFNLQTNAVFSGYKTNHNITNVMVGNFYQIVYYSYAGYTLQNKAFILNSEDNLLQEYEDANPSQKYTITGGMDNINNLDGTWLREKFYSVYNDCKDYNLTQTDLGTILVQTGVLEFNYGVKIYDSTEEEPIIEEFSDGTFALDAVTGIGTTNGINNYLDFSKGYGTYKSGANVYYALLNSRLYFPNNKTTTDRNFYTTYPFLINSSLTNDEIMLTSSSLAFMVTAYEEGKIIAPEYRNVFLMLEVRKLYEIEMKVMVSEFDSNSTRRTTTISNGTNNSQSISISKNATHTAGAEFYPTTVKAVTYHGATNSISSQFDAKRYLRVEYYLGDVATALPSNISTFSTETNTTLKIKYVPRLLDLEYGYTLNGADINEDAAQEFIKTTKPDYDSGYKIGDVVNFKVEVVGSDYAVRVKINGRNFGASATEINCAYSVSNDDFGYDAIQIITEIFSQENAKVNISYQLLDYSKRDSSDDYGKFNVYINNTVEVYGTDSASIDVIEGRNVYVSLSLNVGYTYYGIKKGTLTPVQVIPDANGKILIIENFDLIEDSTDYLIIIDKVSISAVFDTANAKTKEFKDSLAINDKLELNDLYVGATVNFSFADVDAEKLDYFYYLTATNDEVKIDESNNLASSIKITSDMFNVCGQTTIRFGVKTISRYNLVLDVVGREYLEQEVKVFYVDGGGVYDVGTYCDAGTELTLEVIPNNASEGVYKYDILFNSGTYDVINKNDIKLTLNNNLSYTITITPKEYNVSVNEFVYNSLKQISTEKPLSVTENQVNNMYIDGVTKFNNLTTLEFTLIAYKESMALDREISRIVISGNDQEDAIIIEFNQSDYVAKVKGVEVNLYDYGYLLTTTNNRFRLTYQTQNNITIGLYYKDYKTISSG